MTFSELDKCIFQIKNESLKKNLLNLNLQGLSSEARGHLQELVFSVLKTEWEMTERYYEILGVDLSSEESKTVYISELKSSKWEDYEKLVKEIRDIMKRNYNQENEGK